jgi:hypothetical protein
VLTACPPEAVHGTPGMDRISLENMLLMEEKKLPTLMTPDHMIQKKSWRIRSCIRSKRFEGNKQGTRWSSKEKQEQATRPH